MDNINARTGAANEQQEERLVDAITGSLVEYLLTCDCSAFDGNLMTRYSNEDDGASPLVLPSSVASKTSVEVVTNEWMPQLLAELRRRLGSHVDEEKLGTKAITTPDTITMTEKEKHLLQRSLSKAIPVWKSKQQQQQEIKSSSEEGPNSSATIQKSFSLLDKWIAAGGGSLLANFVTAEQIQDAPDYSTKLSLLKKVQHVDDVLQDWDEKIQPIMLRGLQGGDREEESTIMPSLIEDYTELHRKWFHQTRKQRAVDYGYLSLQLDLCGNIFTVLTNNKPDLHALHSKCMRLFQQMWLDWMLSAPDSLRIPNNDRINSIGQACWRWTLADEVDKKNFQLLEQLATVDPAARWFSSWINHLSVDNVLALVTAIPADDQSSLLHSNLPPVCVLVDRSYRTALAINNESNNTNSNSGATTTIASKSLVCRYSLSILSAILMKTRVAFFPWYELEQKLVEQHRTKDIGSASSKIVALFDLFLTFMQQHCNRSQAQPVTKKAYCCGNERDHACSGTLAVIGSCCTAVDVILWGCRNEKLLFSLLIEKVEKVIHVMARANSNKHPSNDSMIMQDQLVAILQALGPCDSNDGAMMSSRNICFDPAGGKTIELGS